jgi:hypothetical protein
MKCNICSKDDASRSVDFILSEGTIDSSSETFVTGSTNTSFRGGLVGHEEFRGERTGYDYQGMLKGESFSSSEEVHNSTGITQSRLAARLDSAFGSHLGNPELVANEAALEYAKREAESREKYYISAAAVTVIWLGLDIGNGFVFWSILFGVPLSLLIAGIGWFMHGEFGVSPEVAKLAASSPLNRKRLKLVNDFNKELDGLYGWLRGTSYCSRCNVLNDEGASYSFRDLQAARPTEPKLPR